MQLAELPAPLTRLVGRAAALNELRRLLAQTRLLTLVGAGGVGKTRLALELARGSRAAYPDGVVQVQIAALTEAALVPQAVAVVAMVREPPDRPLLEQLAHTLRDRQLLLVLDNCEHLLDACAELVGTLLASCPRLSILATSRERLGLTGETVWRVPSLAFPWPQAQLALDKLVDYAAVQLFMDRVAEARPGFAIGSSPEAAAVASICYRLDGIPLALELAAARISVLGLQEIADRLDDRFRLLTGGRRAALPRHQTLRASVSWSHDLLSPSELALFRRLSVFTGGWTLEAANALTGEDVLDVLGQLVDKSLVQTSDHAGATRYALLETIRAFASERLHESGEEAAVRERHATFFLGLAEQAGPGIRGPDQQHRIEQLQVDYDNLRAAARWYGDDSARAPLGLRLAAALWEFWHVRGYLGEAARWLEGALDADSGPSPARAEALDGLGVVTALRGDNERAATLFAESETLFGVLGQQPGRVHAMSNRGIASLMRGNAVQATELAQQALAIARSTGGGWAEAYAQYALGWASRFSGDVELSVRCVADSAALFGSVGDERGRAFALHLLGPLLMDSGRAAEALGPLREAVGTFAVLEDAWGILNVLSQTVRLVAELGEFQHAARLLGASRALRERIGAELLPVLQQPEERGAALARSHLDEPAFEAAVLAGRGLSLDEAIAEVLRPTQTSASRSLVPGTVPPGMLTRREHEVAELIAEGLTNRQIADRLIIAERTADTHVQNILAKLGCVSRAQIAALIQPKAET